MVNFNKIANDRIQIALEKNLTYLNLSNLFLKELPESLSQLQNLTELNLSNNCLSDYPKVLAKLYNLDVLDLSNNLLNDINLEVGKYYSLRYLDLSCNFFLYIPRYLSYLKNLEDVIFDGNPIFENIPEEILSGGIWAVENYLNELKSSKEIHRLFEAKLLIVGSGEVGKTTIMKVLKDKDYKVKLGEESSTHGINIIDWDVEVFFPAVSPFYNRFRDSENLYIYDESDSDEADETGFESSLIPIDQAFINNDSELIEYIINHNDLGDNFLVKQNIKVNIWDFGGQEIYHSTHQFFLTKRSIYLFVWDARKDQDEESFDYWLNIIRYLSNNSPVIIVMNKVDERFKNIDESAIKKEYKNIISFHKISCLTKEGVNELKSSIIDTLSSLKHLGDQLPSVWLDLNKHLKDLDKDFIDTNTYYDICKRFQLSTTRADFLSEYLHDLGKILHFKKDNILKNIVILNPKWATMAFYSLIGNITIQKNGGRFSLNDLSQLWDNNIYPTNKHFELIKLMEKFELCFNLIGTEEYIIPELLRMDRPADEIGKYEDKESMIFEYQYKFMPSGLVNRLICSLYFIIKNNFYWKNGVILKNEMASALIQESKFNKTITIKIIGNNRSNLLAVIRTEFKRIHTNFSHNGPSPLAYIEKIPCNCNSCQSGSDPYMFDYNVLLRFIEREKEYIDCQKSTESINILKLIQGIKSNKSEIDLINYMILAASQLQGNYLNIRGSEDNRNSFIATVLSNKGIIAKDQTRWGISEGGKLQGELDIKIENAEGLTISIFEGFNLKYCNKTIIDKHINKIIGYDPNGLADNFVFVYSEASNFLNLFKDYYVFLSEIVINNTKFEAIYDVSNEFSKGVEIKIIRSQFYRQERKCNLYHILINLNFEKGR